MEHISPKKRSVFSEEKRGMSREQIKIVAIAAMTVNHIALVFFLPGTIVFEVFVDTGYITAITMCFFLVEGYYHTHSKVAYMQRLAIFGVISQLPYTLALGQKQLNMMFTLLICFLMIYVVDKIKCKLLAVILTVILFCCTYYCSWSFRAAAFTILFVLTYKRKETFVIPYTAAFIIQFAVSLYEYQLSYSIGLAFILALGASLGVVISGCLISRYNGQCTNSHKQISKWFFYLYYPLHLALLFIIKLALGGK